MKNFEQLGLFYLGRKYDLDGGRARDDFVLYDSRHLTTHAVCVGMTGSGKTGLCLALLEEAAIDNVPVIAIDPKGDLGNLLLTFPELRGEDFLPWIDRGEAERQGKAPEQYAHETAERWRQGLADWGQSGERIAKFRATADLAIYTPGSESGLPLSILETLAPPPPATLQNTESLGDLILSTVSGLLALVGIESDPLTGREHILLSKILQTQWRDGKTLDMAGLLRAIQSPPFAKVGLMDLETFYPANERFKLAMMLNNLLASPGFAAWTHGEPLDINRLFYTDNGRPRISILSIAHLSDSERMFFVTLLLNEVVAWMRTQSGTTSLRAILYMDEVFGYFPPTANPPAKRPMLTLLKQARAFGLGVVLATQNPVDLDYKGLANAGTWFLGRLQTERDKARVLDGLEGASAVAGGGFDRQKMDATLSRLGNRVFLLHDVHESEPAVFQTRWALSYLRGPLTRDQIAALTQDRKKPPVEGAGPVHPSSADGKGEVSRAAISAEGNRPVLPPDIPELFWSYRGTTPSGHHLLYVPSLLGQARLHFAQAKSGIDVWQKASLVATADDASLADPWSESEYVEEESLDLETTPSEGAAFASLPAAFAKGKSYTSWTTSLKNHLYRTRTLSLFRSSDLKVTSLTEESERDFRLRLVQQAREQRDAAVETLRDKYAKKLAAIEEKMRRAQQRVDREKAQASQSTFQAAVTFGSSILGALVGKKRISAANVGRAAASARAASRAAQQRSDVTLASDDVERYERMYADLEDALQAEIDELQTSAAPESLSIEAIEVRPKKSEIDVERVVLVWTPWWSDGAGRLTKAH
jgi:hypothetical protein